MWFQVMRDRVLGCMITALWGLCWSGTVQAQTLPPGAAEAVGRTLGNRVEAFSVLGGDRGLIDGKYTWPDQHATVDITKFAWQAELYQDDPLPLWNGLRWSPLIEGAGGYLSSRSQNIGNVLEGNETISHAAVISLGVGARVYFTDDLSVLCAVDVFYTHINSRLDAQTAFGRQVLAELNGSSSDLALEILTFAPQAEIRYRHRWGDIRLEVTSRFVFFHDEIVGSAPQFFEAESQIWHNSIFVEYWTPLRFWDQQVRVGAGIDRAELYGGLSSAADARHVYTAGGHVVTGPLWIFEYIGLYAAHEWATSFSGNSLGVDISVAF